MQVHKEPMLLNRILNRLEHENHYFLINIDSKSLQKVELEAVVKEHNNVLGITKLNVMHGGFSQISCTVEQMKMALVSPIKFDYFHTISGQDYPCVDADKFDMFFQNNDRSYMMMDTDQDIENWLYSKYKERLEHWKFWDVFNDPISRKLHIAGVFNRLTHWIPRKCDFLNEIWGGWNWFSLRRDAVSYLTDYIEEHPDFYYRFKFTHCCDELIYSTILNPVSEKYRIVRRNSLRYIQWHPTRSYKSLPLILNINELQDIRKSGALFCRKVELQESEALLDALDKQ
jgi:hypothetical protein